MSGPSSTMTVIPCMGSGGAEAVVEALLFDQLAAGERPVLASTGGFRVAPLQDAGVDFVALCLEGRQVHNLGVSVVRLRAAIQRHRPSLIHAHNVKATLVARLAAGRTLPILTTVHGVPDREYPAAARVLRQCADHVVAVSAGVGARLEIAGVPESRLEVVENGVVPPVLPPRDHARAVLGLPDDAVVVACVARLVPQKRHDLLIAAWRRLRTDAHLLVVGDGPTRPAIEAGVAAARCPRIRLLGEREDVGTVFAASDVVVLPTDWEGLPISLLEAMSAGVPAVVSEVGDLRHSVGAAVRLVPPGSAEELRAALGSLLASPQERAELARRGRALVAERFGPEQMLSAYRSRAAHLRSPDAVPDDVSPLIGARP